MTGALFLALFLVVAGLPLAAGAQNPHEMLDESGKLDMSACSFCHEDSLELSRPKEEVCTFCHAETTHAGSAEHLRAPAAEVARVVPKGDGQPEIPLTDGGRLYCASCHLFHDPAVMGEKWQAEAWIPPASGLALAVRRSLDERLESLAREQGEAPTAAEFATTGTRLLRLPVADGSLCRHCHGDLVK
jgi:hypothetical protein